MANWRMAFRNGTNGFDLWPDYCCRLGIAIIQYTPINGVDLSLYTVDRLPDEWALLGSPQKTSLKRFVFEMNVPMLANQRPWDRVLHAPRLRPLGVVTISAWSPSLRALSPKPCFFIASAVRRALTPFPSPARGNAVKHFRPIGACHRRTPFWRPKCQTLNHRTPLLPRPPKAVEAGAECRS